MDSDWKMDLEKHLVKGKRLHLDLTMATNSQIKMDSKMATERLMHPHFLMGINSRLTKRTKRDLVRD